MAITPLADASRLTAPTVEVWQNNQWTYVPDLACRDLRTTVQPVAGISKATLIFEYGEIDNGPDNTGPGGFELVNPLGHFRSPVPKILQQFVRVRFISNENVAKHWVGVVTAVDDRDRVQHSTVPPDVNLSHDGPHSFGTQVIQVSGPEYLLDRKQLTASHVFALADVQRAIPFNIRYGRIADGSAEQFGNKHNLFNAFSGEDDAVKWKASDIISYLTAFFPQRFIDASPVVLWDIVNEEAVDIFTPQFDPHGMTLLQVLAELVSAKRWTHYVIRYEPDANLSVFGKFVIYFNTNTANNIQVPSGSFVAGNPNLSTLSTSGTVGGKHSKLDDAQSTYRKVIAQGARRGVVCTVQVGGDFLEEGWTSTQLTQYENGAQPFAMAAGTWETDLAGNPLGVYTANNAAIQKSFRTGNPVFTRFVCAHDADFEKDLGDGPEDVILTPQFVKGLRWQRWIPLKVGWDYSVDPPKALLGAPSIAEYRVLDSIYLIRDQLPLQVYAYGSALGSVIGDSETWRTPSSVTTRPLEDDFGLTLTPRVQSHWQASTASDIIDEDIGLTRMFNYKTDIQVTGYFQLDEYAKGQFPEVADIDDANTLTLRFGDIAFDDTLLKGTVVDIEAGGLKTAPKNLKIPERDDTELLRDIAAMAYRWYGQHRVAYAFTYKQLVTDIDPGRIADLIDGDITDSLITDVTWSFETGTTTISTGYSEPDFGAILREVKGQ